MQPYPPPREGKPVSFFIAIFLGLLLLVSAGLNVILLLFSILGSAAGTFTSGFEQDSANYRLVAVGGDPNARFRVLRVPIVGAISEASNPLLGASGGIVSRLRAALRSAEQDASVRGVVLDINSPGGGVTDSDLMYQMVRDFRRENPDKRVVALFGDLAASGGYYLAVACDYIIARRTSITGSIGVIMSAYNFTEAAKDIGVSEVVIKSTNTPYKDMLSPFREITEEERQLLTGIVEELYQQFVTVVDEGRPALDRNEVIALANGGIYSAGQARNSGLIDEVGGQDEAIRWLEDNLEVESVQVIEQRRLPTLGELLFGVVSGARHRPSLDEAAGRLLESATGPRFLYYWPGAR